MIWQKGHFDYVDYVHQVNVNYKQITLDSWWQMYMNSSLRGDIQVDFSKNFH